MQEPLTFIFLRMVRPGRFPDRGLADPAPDNLLVLTGNQF